MTAKPTLLLLLFALPAAAQDSLLLRSYDFLRQTDPWLTASNAAALTHFTAPGIVEAEARLTATDGRFVDFDGAANALTAGAGIESVTRISPQTVVRGAIRYDNFSGRQMSGSAFLSGSHRPFDIVEDSLTNAGRKHSDTYSLSGSVGHSCSQRLSVGAAIDYTSANYAKYKDLRHKNKLMDMHVSAGLFSPLTRWLSVGADYSYHRRTEALSFGTYGKSDKVYKSLVDYGAFMGTVEQFGNQGYTDQSHEMPLFEDGHGFGIQTELTPWQEPGSLGRRLSLFAALDYRHSSGYYGRRSPYTATLTGHDRDELGATARLSLLMPQDRYMLEARFMQEKLLNRANTFREMTSADNGANYYEYYDPVETGRKRWCQFDVKATALLGIQGEMPRWDLQADYSWRSRRQDAYLFPNYRHQLLTTQRVGLSACRHLLTRGGLWSLAVSAAWQNGFGRPFTDGSLVDDLSVPAASAAANAVAPVETFLYREYSVLTSPQYSVGANIGYDFVPRSAQTKLHTAIEVEHLKAVHSSLYCLGTHHTALSVVVGCTF